MQQQDQQLQHHLIHSLALSHLGLEEVPWWDPYLHLSLSHLALRQQMYLHIQRLRLSLGHTLALIGVINPLWLEMGMAMEMGSDGQSGFFSRPFLVIDDKGGEEQGLKLQNERRRADFRVELSFLA